MEHMYRCCLNSTIQRSAQSGFGDESTHLVEYFQILQNLFAN
jgi:hypothetical protein